MKITGNEDLRVKKTIVSIRHAFEKLIINTDYEKMDIKMLCEEAMINPKTFLHYYESIDELLIEIQSEMAEDFIKLVSKYNLPEEFDKLNRDFFTALSLKGISYERILMSGNFGYTRFKAISQVLDAVFKDNSRYNELDTFKKEVLINFMNTTSLDIYRKWVDEGKKIPLKDIIEMSNSLMQLGMKGFIG